MDTVVSARKYLWSGEGGEGRGDVVLHVAKASPFPFAMYHIRRGMYVFATYVCMMPTQMCVMGHKSPPSITSIWLNNTHSTVLHVTPMCMVPLIQTYA